MAEEEKVEEQSSPEGQEESSEKGKSNGLIKMIIIGVVVFVVGIGGFSFMMGVFSSPEKAEDEGEKDKKVEVDTKHTEKAKPEESEDDDFLAEIAQLEEELFGIHDVTDAEDMDDIMSLVDEEEESQGMSEEDSVEAVKWLESEKAKLAKERAEVDNRQKELDKQEYRLKQLFAKKDQMQSTRVGSLAKLYDGMKPSQVAPLITQLNDTQAVDILLKMKPGNAAKILGAISPKRAARISAQMITLTEEN